MKKHKGYVAALSGWLVGLVIAGVLGYWFGFEAAQDIYSPDLGWANVAVVFIPLISAFWAGLVGGVIGCCLALKLRRYSCKRTTVILSVLVIATLLLNVIPIPFVSFFVISPFSLLFLITNSPNLGIAADTFILASFPLVAHFLALRHKTQ